MQFTKMDFVQYLKCPKSLWIRKREPESYPHGESSAVSEKLTRDGYEVERYVRQFFESTADKVDFQVVFETDDGLFAKADALERLGDGRTALYDVQLSTRVKTDLAHNHVKQACFQKICAERSGQQIDRVCIVHLNGEYVREGEIDPASLLVLKDVTDEVDKIREETVAEIDAALGLLGDDTLDQDGCSCLHKSRGNHCSTFARFNPGIPTPSIYSLPRLSAKKRADFLAKGIFDLKNVPEGYQLSADQNAVVQAVKSGRPTIDLDQIRAFVDALEFPLYFLDFEAYASAIPMIDYASPHKAFPVQYSLHILDSEETLSHREFLEREARLPDRLIAQMEEDIGPQGSVVSWHASFEKTQNREMGKWFPRKVDFLDDINARMVDLEDLFKTAYVDAKFDGSTSIKKVLPVVCPNLGYTGFEVQDGTQAMEAWEQLVKTEGAEADQIANALLHYCKRDTFAMVEIYRFLMGCL